MDVDETLDQRLAEAKALNVGGPPVDSQATLCIYAENIDPSSVSELIGCQPTRARRKGERDPSRPKVGPAPIGQWFLEAPEGASFEDKIDFLLASTTGTHEAWDVLAESHRLELRTAIFLRSWTEGFDLPNATLAEIAKRRWSFSLSMYSAEGNEIIEAFLAPSEQSDAKDAEDLG